MTKKPQPYLKKKARDLFRRFNPPASRKWPQEGILQDGHAHPQKPTPAAAAAKGDKMQDKSVPELYS